MEDFARHIALEVENLQDTVLLLLRHGLASFQSGLELAQQWHLTHANDLNFGIGTVFVADPDENVVEFAAPARCVFAMVPPLLSKVGGRCLTNVVRWTMSAGLQAMLLDIVGRVSSLAWSMDCLSQM